jgi:hypothetical protein
MEVRKSHRSKMQARMAPIRRNRRTSQIFRTSDSIRTDVTNPISDPERTAFTTRTSIAQNVELQLILHGRQTTEYSRDCRLSAGAARLIFARKAVLQSVNRV